MRIRRILVCLGSLILLGCATSQVPTGEASDLRLSFAIDKEYDKENILRFFRQPDPAGLESRAASMGIDIDIARRIRDAVSPSEAWDLAARIVDDRFKNDGAAIEASQKDLEAVWKDLLPLYSRVVVETTESPWVHPEYTCLVSSVHPGLSSWSGNKVAVKFDGSPELKRRIVAHELLLSNVFQLLRKRFARSEISDWRVWAFSEITPVLILDDPRLRTLWPNSPHAGGYFIRSNYPQLAGLEKRLKELFDHRTSYLDYEEKSAAVLKGFQPSFIGKDRVEFGWLGVFVANLQEKDSYRQLAKEMNVTGAGALILGLYKGSPADRAGLMPGDYVTAVGSTPIEDAGRLTQFVRALAGGTTTSMTVLRLGEQKVLSVTIGVLDAKDTIAQGRNLWPGFTVKDITDEILQGTESPRNARVVVVDSIAKESPAAVAGFKVRDRITAVNGINVETAMEFYEALNANGGRDATFAITREGNEISLRL